MKKYFKFIVLLGLLTGHCQAGTITPAVTVSTQLGVAPLSVFFDASGTTGSTTSRPFHDLEYRWDFGDPAGSPVSGTTWAYGARPGVSSRNAATGPVAAHVYETSGTYTVALSVTDGANTVTNNYATIVVQDPEVIFAGANTICFSVAADYTGCPAGATHVQTSNFATAVNNYINSTRRLLFRRGETFNAAASAGIGVAGPGIIGAYGTGAPPKAKIAAGATYPIIQISGSDTPGIADWRIMDLELDGSSVINGDVSGIASMGGFDRLLVLRLYIHDIYRGVAAGIGIMDYWNNNGQPGHTLFKDWAVVDSSMTGIPGCNWDGHYECDWRVYISGTRCVVQGNFLDNQNTGGSHVVRSEYMDHSLIANNDIIRAGGFQHAIKIHSVIWQSVGVADPAGVGVNSEKFSIADNRIGGGINPWTVSLGPQDEISNEHVRNILFERNWITSGSGSQLLIETSAGESTYRNNIFDMTGAAWHTGIGISRRGIEPIPSDVRVYNNTFYSATTGDFVGVSIGGTTTNVTVRNNLGSAPSATDPVMIDGTGASGFVQSNNLLNNTPSALFVSAAPTAPNNFRLKALPNPARDTGFALPVFSDFVRANRPLNSLYDIGAFEGSVASTPPVAPRNFRLQ